MTYTYLVLSGPSKGLELEIEQSIKDPALEKTEVNGKMCRVKRLISAGTPFILKGDCWARTNYDRGVQSMPTKEERANLGKPK